MKPEFEGLGLVELLDLLEPVPEPPAIPLTPQTPGWIVLVVVLAGIMVLTVRSYRMRRLREAYRHAALAELANVGDDPAALANILRRTALSAYPRASVACLSGDDWLHFLDRTYAGSGFAKGAGRLLSEAPYRDCAPDPALTALVRDWITRHDRRVPC